MLLFTGVHAPPMSVTGQPLPSARAVSVVLFPDVDIKDKRWTLITMQWGQIITHDMSMAMGNTQASEYRATGWWGPGAIDGGKK